MSPARRHSTSSARQSRSTSTTAWASASPSATTCPQRHRAARLRPNSATTTARSGPSSSYIPSKRPRATLSSSTRGPAAPSRSRSNLTPWISLPSWNWTATSTQTARTSTLRSPTRGSTSTPPPSIRGRGIYRAAGSEPSTITPLTTAAPSGTAMPRARQARRLRPSILHRTSMRISCATTTAY